MKQNDNTVFFERMHIIINQRNNFSGDIDKGGLGRQHHKFGKFLHHLFPAQIFCYQLQIFRWEEEMGCFPIASKPSLEPGKEMRDIFLLESKFVIIGQEIPLSNVM